MKDKGSDQAIQTYNDFIGKHDILSGDTHTPITVQQAHICNQGLIRATTTSDNVKVNILIGAYLLALLVSFVTSLTASLSYFRESSEPSAASFIGDVVIYFAAFLGTFVCLVELPKEYEKRFANYGFGIYIGTQMVGLLLWAGRNSAACEYLCYTLMSLGLLCCVGLTFICYKAQIQEMAASVRDRFSFVVNSRNKEYENLNGANQSSSSGSGPVSVSVSISGPVSVSVSGPVSATGSGSGSGSGSVSSSSTSSGPVPVCISILVDQETRIG